ncbi:MAG: EAL domain-containing protein [Actinomycetia bacterium]|nr:EAL domain-containing protein [Actinomycetes bacterium]
MTPDDTKNLFEANPLPMLVVERQGLGVLAANERAERMYGVPGGLTGWSAARLWPEAERPGLDDLLAEAAAVHHRSGPWAHIDDTGNKHDVGIYCSALEWEGSDALLLVIVDLTDDVARQRALAEGAMRDSLTGLTNSAHFLDRLHIAVSRAAHEPEYRFVVLYLGLDHFREANEQLGHIAADKVLADAGTRLAAASRPGDVVARIGGDEFGVLSDIDTTGGGPLELAERMLRALDEPFGPAGAAISLSASIGVVIGGGPPALQADAIVRNADAAMHRAKQQGRGRYELFDETLRKQAVQYARTEAELKRGLDRDEFALYYQPIVTIPGGDMHSAEALLRWLHPEEGVLTPGAFISVAEESGLITPLGDWVIQEACHQIRVWRDAGLPEMSVAINVSARQFRDGNLCASFRDALADAGIEARYLTAELTESAVMEDPEASIDAMTEMSSMGVGLAMDDFGTGYSSLSYLKRFSFDSLKIDRSFIEGIDSNAGDAALVAAVIALAHSFRTRAVGEGVETPEQLRYLRLLKCDMAQGFLFSKPIPSDDLAAIMRRGAPWRGLT